MACSQGPRSYKYSPCERPGHLIPGSSRIGTSCAVPGSDVIGQGQQGTRGHSASLRAEGRILGNTGACLFISFLKQHIYSPQNVSSKARPERKQKGICNRGWRRLGRGLWGPVQGVTSTLSPETLFVCYCSRHLHWTSSRGM